MILLCWYQSGVRSKNEKSHNFIERALFALSDGGTSWSADVDEQSALAGWGMWSDQCLEVDGCSSFDGLEGQHHHFESDVGHNSKLVDVM